MCNSGPPGKKNWKIVVYLPPFIKKREIFQILYFFAEGLRTCVVRKRGMKFFYSRRRLRGQIVKIQIFANFVFSIDHGDHKMATLRWQSVKLESPPPHFITDDTLIKCDGIFWSVAGNRVN